MFYKVDEKGNQIRNQVVLDCSADEMLTEQSHKDEVDINQIIKRHAKQGELIARTAMLNTTDYRFDDVTGNDFMEASLIIAKAQQSFDQMPHKVRDRFDNNPAKFLDFVQNPENGKELYEMGLAERVPTTTPIQVQVMNQTEPEVKSPETPEA